MKILDAGHKYAVYNIDGGDNQTIQFVNRGHGCDEQGTTTQELLRVLIDRVKFLDSELPWYGNARILMALRHALVLHEMRVLERKVQKGLIEPENVSISNEDGHYLLKTDNKRGIP